MSVLPAHEVRRCAVLPEHLQDLSIALLLSLMVPRTTRRSPGRARKVGSPAEAIKFLPSVEALIVALRCFGRNAPKGHPNGISPFAAEAASREWMMARWNSGSQCPDAATGEMATQLLEGTKRLAEALAIFAPATGSAQVAA